MPKSNGQFKDPVYFSRFLDLNGDGTGSKNATGDYSITPDIFFIQPPTGEIYNISRLIVHIIDTGKMSTDSYGSSITLTNGIQAVVRNDNGTLINLTDSINIFTNLDWAHYTHDFILSNFGTGATPEHITVRWTFLKSGVHLFLNGDNNERLEVQLNDDFSGLNNHRFLVQGYV